MSDVQKTVIDWLRDAHAMEMQSEKLLKGEVDRLKGYPQLRQGLEQHLHQTRAQQQRLEKHLDHLGAKPSTLKDAAGKIVALGQTLSGLVMSDEVIKSTMSIYVFEHMEIASYEILVASAKHMGDSATQELCEELLAEEVAMADWLKQNLAEITHTFLTRTAATENAKR